MCEYIGEEYKPCIFVVNKWDLLVKPMPTEKWVRYLHDTFRTMWYVPIAFITGQTGKNVKALLNHAQMLFKQSRQRVTTGELNRLLREARRSEPAAAVPESPAEDLLRHAGRHRSRRRSCCSATIRRRSRSRISAICCGVLREQLHFGEVPIKLYLRKRQQSDSRDDLGADST